MTVLRVGGSVFIHFPLGGVLRGRGRGMVDLDSKEKLEMQILFSGINYASFLKVFFRVFMTRYSYY